MATDSGPKRQPSLASMILWVLFCFVMWAGAIMGPIILLCWVLSDFVGGIDLGPNPDQTAHLGGGLGAIGLAFVWLRCRGYLKFGNRD